MPDVPPPGRAAERGRSSRRASCRACPEPGPPLLGARAADRAPAGRLRAAIVSRKPLRAGPEVWIRATGALPDDPDIHRCVLAYASDMTLLDTGLFRPWPHHLRPDHPGREPRPCALVPPAVPRRRMAALFPGQPVGLRRPRLQPRQHLQPRRRLIASVAQEGLIRRARTRRHERLAWPDWPETWPGVNAIMRNEARLWSGNAPNRAHYLGTLTFLRAAISA